MTGTAKEIIEYLKMLPPCTEVTLTIKQSSSYQSTGDFRDAPWEPR